MERGDLPFANSFFRQSLWPRLSQSQSQEGETSSPVWVARTHGLGPSSPVVELLRHEWITIWDGRVPGSGFIHCATILAPSENCLESQKSNDKFDYTAVVNLC